MVDGLGFGRMHRARTTARCGRGRRARRTLASVTTAHPPLVFRSLAAFLVCAGLAGTVAGCESNQAPAGDGEPAPLAMCRTQADCTGGTTCSFPIDVGCTALGECRDLPSGEDASSPDCPSAGGPACACTGETIEVPACWDYLAQQAVSYMGACGSLDGGAD